jgi:hypothetical protein
MARQSDVKLRVASKRKDDAPADASLEGGTEVTEELFGRRKPPEAGRFRLQVDRQTKGSYATREAAEAAGLAIKRAYPILHVAVVDAEAGQSEAIALPAQ